MLADLTDLVTSAVAAVPAVPASPADPADTANPANIAARRGVGLLAIVAIVGFGLIFALALALVLKRGRRLRDHAAGVHRPEAHPNIDAWDEAGRRARPEDGDDFIAGYDTGEFDKPSE